MERTEEHDKRFDDGTDRTVSYAMVLNVRESSIENIKRMLEAVPGLRVIYQKVALYELYITPYPPSSWKKGGL